MQKPDKKPRPYWHVDAKWVCGLLLLTCLMSVMLLDAVVRITDPATAPRFTALIVGSMFIKDDQINKTEIKEAIVKNGGSIHPIPTMPSISITEKDLDLSLTDLKIKVFQPITQSIYDNGLQGAADKFGMTPDDKQKFVDNGFALRPLTRANHDAARQLMSILIGVSAVLMLGVTFFSAGWGRLANLGSLLVTSSLPFFLAALMLSSPPSNPKPGDTGPFSFLPPDVQHAIGTSLLHDYQLVIYAGLLLIVTAFVGKLAFAIKHLVEHSKAKAP